jgi:Replication regulatory protein RepB
MAQTSAQRQAAARARRRYQAIGAEQGEHAQQINIFIKASAAGALRRLARYHGITQRQLLENLLITADDQITANWSDEQIYAHYAP